MSVLYKLTNTGAELQLLEEDTDVVCTELSFEQLNNQIESCKEVERQMNFENKQML